MSYTVTFRDLTLGHGTQYPNISLPQGMDVINRQDMVANPAGGAYANGPDVAEVLHLVFEHWLIGGSAIATEALRDTLAGKWGADPNGPIEEITVVLASNIGKVYRGRPAGVSFRNDRLGRQGIMEARCEFSTYDPIWYTAGFKTAFVTMPTGGDGIVWASGGVTVAVGGITVAGGSSSGDTSALNAGSAAVDWQVALRGPITNPRIAVGGGFINMSGVLAAGSNLLVDSRTRTARLDGVYQNWIQPGAVWNKLPAGVTVGFSLRGDTGTGDATLQWRDGNR